MAGEVQITRETPLNQIDIEQARREMVADLFIGQLFKRIAEQPFIDGSAQRRFDSARGTAYYQTGVTVYGEEPAVQITMMQSFATAAEDLVYAKLAALEVLGEGEVPRDIIVAHHPDLQNALGMQDGIRMAQQEVFRDAA